MSHIQRILAIALTALSLAAPAVHAQSGPGKPMTIVVPFPAGGPTDALARLLATGLSKQLGAGTVIVENKPGANTIIAADFVAKQPADGNTLLLTQDATISVNPLLYKSLPYNADRDFTPVSIVIHSPEFLITSAALPVNDFKELLDYIKKNPGKVNYGSFGPGSGPHVAGAGLASQLQLDVVHVPYKGAAQLVPALMNGEVQMYMSAVGQVAQFLESGKVKLIAAMTPERHPDFPNVPTLKELGVPGFDQKVWLGLLAPGKTPAATVQRLSVALKTIIESDEYKQRVLKPFYFEAPPQVGPVYFEKVLKADKEKYGRLVKAANVTLD